jgi:hypothetical protein
VKFIVLIPLLEYGTKMTSRQRRQQKKIEREKALENEKAKAEMAKEDNDDQKIEAVKRGGKDILDSILASIPPGKLGSESEDLRKHLHTMYDKEMEDIGKEKIKQAIDFGEREMREKNLTDIEAMQISSSQIQPIDPKGFGKASDIKDPHTGATSSTTASGSSSSSSSSTGITAHKQEKKQPLDHRKAIYEIFCFLFNDEIQRIFAIFDRNIKLESGDVEYLLLTIEHVHEKLYNYWSLSYDVHRGSKHENIASAMVKMAFDLNKDLRKKKEGDPDPDYETPMRLMKAVIILTKIWRNPETKGEITSKLYMNENYRYTNWMLCLDELIIGFP